MNALQVLYTSCRGGRSGAAGFQVRSCTPGLSESELLEIARLGNFRPPVSGERLKPADHPLALRCMRLKSGRRALIHSCYTGRDYSGREGNFMAHTLVPEQGPPLALPTDFRSWDGWKRGLAPEEDTEEAPPDLAPLNLAKIHLAAFDHRGFADAAAGSKDVLVDLVTALLLGSASGRRIVIRDTADRGWRWIACLLQLLPLATALELSISTYQFDAIDAADVNATVEGTNFSFDATQRDFEFFLFEPATGLRPDFPDREPGLLADVRKYAQGVVGWYFVEPARLRQFMDFMAQFQTCSADRSLVGGFLLFSSLATGQVARPDDFDRMIEFLKSYTRPDATAQSATIALQIADADPDSVGFEELDKILALCLAAAPSAAEDHKVAAIAFALCFELLLLCGSAAQASRVESRWNELDRRFDPAIGYRTLLDEAKLERLRALYRRDDAAINRVARHLIRAVRGTTHGTPVGHPDIRDLIRAAAASQTPAEALRVIQQELTDPKDALALFVYLDTMLESDEQRHAAAICLLSTNATNPAGAWTLRRALAEQGHEQLLLDELAVLLSQGSKRERYQNYLREVAAHAPVFHEGGRQHVTRVYWNALDDIEQDEQAWEWLAGKYPAVPEGDILREVLVRANRRLSIDPAKKEHERVAKHVEELAMAQGIALSPPRATIRALLARGRAGKLDVSLLTQLTSFASQLSAAEYGHVVDLIIESGLAAAKTVNEHVNLVRKLYVAEVTQSFVDIYGPAIERALKVRRRGQDPAPMVIVAWIALAQLEPSPAAPPILRRIAGHVASRREGEVYDILSGARLELRAFRQTPLSEDARLMLWFENEVNERQKSLANSLAKIGWKILSYTNPFKKRH